MHHVDVNHPLGKILGRMTCQQPGCREVFVLREHTDRIHYDGLLDLHLRVHALEHRAQR